MVFIFLTRVHDTNLKVKFDIQWPWPYFKFMETKMACKRDNIITPWLGAFIFLPHVQHTNLNVKLNIQWPWL